MTMVRIKMDARLRVHIIIIMYSFALLYNASLRDETSLVYSVLKLSPYSVLSFTFPQRMLRGGSFDFGSMMAK